MATALYSKYRPKVFNDVVGQKSILQTLVNAIQSNKISHAYMFCGPRGTGKTTMARLLAKAYMCKNTKDGKSPSVQFCGNCEDCTDISKGTHPDVYELDAASRTGVDNVREEIINRVGFAATRGTKKIYIIDEVHMLSTAAFNALLKTLEEPPEHVMFILCTTDPQKVPDTILSRCQRFDFQAISTDDIMYRLKTVCVNEMVEIDEGALRLIAQNASGAMRNALTKLEQIIAFSNGKISEEVVKNSMQDESDSDMSDLIEYLGIRDLPKVFKWCEKHCNQGADFKRICTNLISIIRDMYIKAAGGDINLSSEIESHLSLFTLDRLHRIMLILSELSNNLKTSVNPRLDFEISMAKIANPKSSLSLEDLAERISNLELVATTGDLSPANIVSKETPVFNKSKENVEASNKFENFDENKKQNSQENTNKAKATSNLTDEIKPNIPDKMPETDYSKTREELKKEAQVKNPVKEKEPDLSNEDNLQKLWNTAFLEIKHKYPAFGATLLTANPSYDEQNNQFILSFPASAEFSVGVLKKPESMEKIHAEVKKIINENIGFNIIVMEDDNSRKFNPSFSNKFRINQEDISTTINTPLKQKVDNPVTQFKKAKLEPRPFRENIVPDLPEVNENDRIKEILNNSGAYNITEE